MGYCYVEIENAYKLDLSDEKRIQFEKKYSEIVELFEGELFVKDNEGKTHLILYKSFEFSTRDFPTLDDGLPNKSRATARFFGGVIETKGDCRFSFGQNGFSSEFYTDLFNLLDDWCDTFCATINCGDICYSGSFELLEGGIYADFECEED
jgi:hypothetical protein